MAAQIECSGLGGAFGMSWLPLLRGEDFRQRIGRLGITNVPDHSQGPRPLNVPLEERSAKRQFLRLRYAAGIPSFLANRVQVALVTGRCASAQTGQGACL